MGIKEVPLIIPPTNGTEPISVQSMMPAPIVEDPPPRAGVRGGGLRKIALVGAAPSAHATPWYDPSWEIWAHATSRTLCPRADRYFDIHPWSWIEKKTTALGPGYERWLKENQTPIYMAEKSKKAPASLRYPIERIRAEFPVSFGSITAYMVALALSEGVSHLGFFGIHYAFGSEYEKQRPNAEFWAGVALGRGVQLVIPPDSPFCHEPKELYGYETHIGEDADQRMETRHAHRRETGVEPNPLQPFDITHNHPELVTAGIEKDSDRAKAWMEGRAPLLPNGVPAW